VAYHPSPPTHKHVSRVTLLIVCVCFRGGSSTSLKFTRRAHLQLAGQVPKQDMTSHREKEMAGAMAPCMTRVSLV
jgi:hypothetical protein